MTAASLPELLVHGLTGGEAADDGDDPVALAILDAALRQFELFGMARSTVDDIARRANVSRVTVYRRFANKDVLVGAVLLREVQRFVSGLDAAIERKTDPEDMYVEGFVTGVQAIREHQLLRRLLDSEPETVLPYLTIHAAPLIAAAGAYVAGKLRANPRLRKTMSAAELDTISELLVRIALSYLLSPASAVDIDDADQARAFARRYLIPMLNGGHA